MAEELLNMHGGEMTPSNEMVNQREQFYVPVRLETDDIFCGDERGAEGLEVYIHTFGGGLNVPYNYAVLRETYSPGSTQTTFEDDAASLIPVIIDVAGAHPGVHSDTKAEPDAVFDPTKTDGLVGCGYAQKRQAISTLIAERGAEIIGDAQKLRPELFTQEQDTAFAGAIVSAHGRMANNGAYFASGGRKVVIVAVERGAKVMLVEGDQIGKDGIINLKENSSIKTGAALKAGLPTYNHDGWATQQINDRLRNLYPYDRKQQQIAELLDTIGTMRALGVEQIGVRR